LADNFLTGSLLTLLVPTILLSLIAAWFVWEVKRVPKDTPVTSASPPASEVLAAAEQAREETTPDPPPAPSA
jgi:uncharacterized membrane protein AbrB (regulator of aidB expression)